jgi:hypothetical protein
LLATDKEVTGVLLKEKDGFATYSTYSKGVKTKEKVLNSKREVISEYSYDTNGLITGKVRYSDDYGVTSEAQYINGVRNGFSKANYYEDLDYEGNFSYGIAHGKIKFLDGNYVLQEKTFSNGVINNTVGKTQFSGYFIGNFVNSEKIKLEKELAYKNNKLFSGLAFKSTDGYVSSGTFYKMGVKKAYFEFEENKAKVCKDKFVSIAIIDDESDYEAFKNFGIDAWIRQGDISEINHIINLVNKRFLS